MRTTFAPNDLPVVFVGQRAFDGVAASFVAPVRHVVCCDSGGTVAIARELLGLSVLSLEETCGRREDWSNESVEILATLIRNQHDYGLRQMNVLPYATGPDVWRLTAEGRISDVLGPPFKLRKKLDDKRIAKQIFGDLGLPVIEGYVKSLELETLQQAIHDLSSQVIVRAPFGASGNQTLLLNEKTLNSFLDRSYIGADYIFEKYLNGVSLCVNIVIAPDALIIYQPSIQLIGVPALTGYTFGYCGNDFVTSKNIPSATLEDIYKQSASIGSRVRDMGYLGNIGVDYLATHTTVYPLEINARHQNSTSLLNLAFIGEPNMSPAWRHLEAFTSSRQLANNLIRPMSGSVFTQLIVHSKTSDIAYTVLSSPKEGIYRQSSRESWDFVSRTCDPNELQEGDVLLTGGCPDRGLTITGDATLFKLISRLPAFASYGGEVARWVPVAADYFRNMIVTESASWL